MIYLIGIVISLFLFLLLLQKKDKSRPDKVLTYWLFLTTIHQIIFYLFQSGISFQYPHLLGLDLPISILHGLLLFLYVSETTHPNSVTPKMVGVHLIPFLLLVVLAIPFYVLSGQEKILVFENEGEGYEWYIVLKLIMIMGLGYVVASWLLIRKHRTHVQEIFSNTDKKNLKWLEYLSIGLGLIWLLTLFFDDTIIFSGVVVLILFIGFFGINQLQIFSSNLPLANAENPKSHLHKQEEIILSPQNENATRYAKSGLKEEEAERVYARLTYLMVNDNLYKKNDLTLTELAKKVEIHPNYLSQVINEKEGKNFYHYINSFRVQECIRRISQPKNHSFTLLSIAYDCGFNSKSTFNKYFKQHTGKTPSEFFISVK